MPSIEALQRGVQEAWQAGFDVRGAEQLDHRILGTRKWVGTTEAAALVRSFGIRARVVDFTGQQVLGTLPKPFANLITSFWPPSKTVKLVFQLIFSSSSQGRCRFA